MSSLDLEKYIALSRLSYVDFSGDKKGESIDSIISTPHKDVDISHPEYSSLKIGRAHV